MYKYMGVDEKNPLQVKPSVSDHMIREFSRHLKPDMKNKRIFKLCNSPEDINSGVEGIFILSIKFQKLYLINLFLI